MKKIFCIFVALMLMFPIYAQRGGNISRASNTTTRSSISSNRASSVRSYSPRSTVSYNNRTLSTSRSNSEMRTNNFNSRQRPTRTESARSSYTNSSNRSNTNTTYGRPHGSSPTVSSEHHRLHHRPIPPKPIHHHGATYRPRHYCMPPHYYHHVYIRPINYIPIIWTTGYYWYGWWDYCYTYPSQDIVVFRQYVNTSYNKEIIAYTLFDDHVYTIVKEDGNSYIEIFAKNDELVFKYKIGRRYDTLTVDIEMNGVWVEKSNHRNPFFIGYDEEFYVYEID